MYHISGRRVKNLQRHFAIYPISLRARISCVAYKAVEIYVASFRRNHSFLFPASATLAPAN